MGRGSNLSRLGDFNQTVVFDAIRRTPGGISRVELVAETGLTAQTVSNIVRRLLDQELIVETGRVQSAVRGKPRTLLRVEPSARFAVGVHVDPATLTYVLIDIEGLMYFDIEWEHAFLRLRFGADYGRLSWDGLDERRMSFYTLAMRLSLVAGPLRLIEGDFPGRAAMRGIAEHNLQQALTFIGG